MPPNSVQTSRSPLGEVARVFLRLGLTSFGGPAAHIAAMEDELVTRRAWVTHQEFVDLVSASNVIPGPNSTELAIHLGFRRAGWPGLVMAGIGFIVPATLIVWAVAMAYVRDGTRPEVAVLLSGVQPVVLAVVVQAVWRLARSLLRTAGLIAISIAATIAVLVGVHELAVLAIAAVTGLLLPRANEHTRAISLTLPSGVTSVNASTVASGIGVATSATMAAAVAPTAFGVLLSFLKIGSVLFGSGYVLLAFLRAEFVTRNGWLTETQLLDAIAIGQVTPGPLFTSATFVGYLLAGHSGAAAASIGIFLPAFLFVAVSGPLVRRVRASPRASSALDGVNAASLALMCAVAILMLRPITTSIVSLATFAVAAVVLLRTRIGVGWLLLAGAGVGLLRMGLLGQS